MRTQHELNEAHLAKMATDQQTQAAKIEQIQHILAQIQNLVKRLSK